jgi:four helix bundle protein
MAEIKSFRDLNAWQMGIKIVEGVYEVTATFPVAERYGLTAQIRRAAVSVPSNIAEGHGAGGSRWSLRHVRTALGSLAEVETQLEIAIRLRFTAPAMCNTLLAYLGDARRLLYGMRRERLRKLGVATTGLAIFILVIA